jgi:glyoxylase-like metal-dependent hydrolase (beta-lactamase superfamily II)
MMLHAHQAFLLLLPVAFAGSLSAQGPAHHHRVKVGTLEVTALLDGEIRLAPTLLKGIDLAEAEALLGGPGGQPTPVNAFLVRSGPSLILVDTGGSQAMNGALGHIQERLKEAGVNPDAVQAVLITHFHGDHMGGLLTADGRRTFPNALVRVAQAENDYWLDPATEAALPEARKAMITQLKAALAPYQAAGKYRPFAPGEAPFQGVEALPATGHTPGHTVYVFGGGAQAFWAVGDVVHFGKVQFPHPEVTVSFDSNGPKAAASRKAVWTQAASQGAVLGSAHLPYPGLGKVEVRGQGFAWLPVP